MIRKFLVTLAGVFVLCSVFGLMSSTWAAGTLASIAINGIPVDGAVSGTQVQLSAAGFDDLGNPIPGLTFTNWYIVSGTGTAMVDSGGMVTCFGAGSVFVRVKDVTGTVIGSAALGIIAGPPALIGVYNGATSVASGVETPAFTAEAKDAQGNTIIPFPIFTWFTGALGDTGTAYIGIYSGVAMGKKRGIVTIKAKTAINDVTGLATLNVTGTYGGLTLIDVDGGSPTVKVGESTSAFVPVPLDFYNNTMPDNFNYTCSIGAPGDTGQATIEAVNATCVATGETPGVVTVNIASGNVTGTKTFNVTLDPVTNTNSGLSVGAIAAIAGGSAAVLITAAIVYWKIRMHNKDYVNLKDLEKNGKVVVTMW